MCSGRHTPARSRAVGGDAAGSASPQPGTRGWNTPAITGRGPARTHRETKAVGRTGNRAGTLNGPIAEDLDRLARHGRPRCRDRIGQGSENLGQAADSTKDAFARDGSGTP